MSGKKTSSKNTLLETDDAPELTEDFFKHADLFAGEKLIRKDRPKGTFKENPKAPVKIRLDEDVLEAIRASGDGWQTRINDALRASLRLSGKLT